MTGLKLVGSALKGLSRVNKVKRVLQSRGFKETAKEGVFVKPVQVTSPKGITYTKGITKTIPTEDLAPAVVGMPGVEVLRVPIKGLIQSNHNGGSLNQIPFYQGGTPEEGIQVSGYRTKEEVDAINARERQMAKTYLTSTPSIGNIARGLYHAWNGWVDPETYAQTGVAPTPGKTAKLLPKRGRGRPPKYATDEERLAAIRERARRYYRTKVEDKQNGVKFRDRKQDKLEQTYQTSDTRRANKGYSIQQRQKDDNDWKMMQKYSGFRSKADRIDLREAQYYENGHGDKSVLDKINADRKALLELFRNTYGY